MIYFRKQLVKWQNFLLIKLVVWGFKTKRRTLPLVRLGTDYGGWWIPDQILSDSSKTRVLISAGLGFDVSFDEALLQAGFEVIGLDPLEESVNYASESLKNYRNFTCINLGLWSITGSQNFFPPKNRLHDAWSATNVQNANISSSRRFDVISLQKIFEIFPQLNEADYRAIKMDIEGAETELIPSIVRFEGKFNFLAIEMDFLSLIPFVSLLKRIKMAMLARNLLNQLDQRGYHLVKNENFNFFWQSI